MVSANTTGECFYPLINVTGELSHELTDINFNNITDPLENGANADQPLIENESMKLRDPAKNIWRVTGITLWMLCCGASDAAPGALLPAIEKAYGISYSIASLIWLGNAMGFILVACLAHKIDTHITIQYILTTGTECLILMYAIVLSGTKFPVIVVGFLFGGIGMAMILSTGNVFLSRFGEKLSKYLSIAQSCYGIGATVSPLLATSFVGADIKWNFFYLILLGLMVALAFVLYFAFEGSSSDLGAYKKDETHSSKDMQNFKSAITNRITWLNACFVFFYQGSEVSMGGWIVTYLLDYRDGTHSVGYVATGFWGGVALGRLVLVWPLHKRLGARRSVTICSLVAIVMVVITWTVPNLVVASIFVSLAGFFVGPNYPMMIKYASEILPNDIQVISLTIATAFGSGGGAVFPFLIGLVSQKAGAFVVLPAFISLYSVMLILWLCLPNKRIAIGQNNKRWWQRIW